jgi:sec-independent protein translocase protein TatC
MELMEHLGELRTRIIRSVLYVVVGMVLTYNLFHQIYSLLTFPLRPILNSLGVIAVPGIQTAFLIRMQIAFISGIAMACPLIVLELWGFIEPALTIEERKPVKYLAPFSVLLFMAGIGTGYACLPATFGWMASYIQDLPKVALIQEAQQYIVLTVKIILAFGISFQLPMVLLFLARIGLITAELMTTYWRHATVGIAVAAAILTPSNDPLTMLMMAVPMAGLYLLSIGLVRAFEPKADGTRAPAVLTMLLVALAPIGIILAVLFWLLRPHLLRPIGAAATVANGHVIPGMPGAAASPAPPAADAAQIQQLQSEVDALSKRLDALQAKPVH